MHAGPVPSAGRADAGPALSGRTIPAGSASPRTLAHASSAPGGTSPSTDPTALPELVDDAERRRELKKYKAIATGLLGLATAVYFACLIGAARLGEVPGWVGYVKAASEAAMVGALADWFAVTALFRRPLGLPIPHTAIIRRKKDQVGEALAGFVGTYFLNPQLITEKIRQADVPMRLGMWLAPEGEEAPSAHAQRVSTELANAVASVIRGVNAAEAEALIKELLIDRLAAPAWGPPAGRLLEQMVVEGKAQPIAEAIVEWAYTKALNSQETIERLLDQRAPSWAPRFVNDLVGAKVYREVVDFAYQVKTDPNHEARRALHRTLVKWAQDLQYDATMITRVENFKQDVLGSAAVQAAPAQMWEHASKVLLEQCADPESRLRVAVAQAVHNYGLRLCNEPELRERWSARVLAASEYVVHNFGPAVAGIIAETVARWDADEASDKIELMVGKDLQYIRLNGTIVGALAGLVIYTISQLVV